MVFCDFGREVFRLLDAFTEAEADEAVDSMSPPSFFAEPVRDLVVPAADPQISPPARGA